MIDGGWAFVWAAYAIAGAALGALALIVLARLMHWAARAKQVGRER